MIRRHASLLRVLLMACDGIGAVVVLWLVAALRFGTIDTVTLAMNLQLPIGTVALYVGAWLMTLNLYDLYRLRTRWTAWREFVDVLRATGTFAVFLLAVLFVTKSSDVSRIVVLGIMPGLALAAVLDRAVIRRSLTLVRQRGRNTRFMLIIGANPAAFEFADRIRANPYLGLQVIGHLGGETDQPQSDGLTLGGLDDLEAILHELIVDEVAICLGPDEWSRMDDIAEACEEEGKIVRIPVRVPGKLVASHLEELDGLAIYTVTQGVDRAFQMAAKRTVDVLVSGVALLLLAIPLLLIGISVRASSPGPALFRQTRAGLHGRRFTMLKFRTMDLDAEQRLEEMRARNHIVGPAFKVDGDPRITRVGRWLRRTSVDELPQLWNVLHGEMSIVGPRPPIPDEVAQYDAWHRRRLSMKPGLTGLWQITARGEPDFDRWVELDLKYIDSWSLWLDLRIMARTVPALLQGR